MTIVPNDGKTKKKKKNEERKKKEVTIFLTRWFVFAFALFDTDSLVALVSPNIKHV